MSPSHAVAADVPKGSRAGPGFHLPRAPTAVMWLALLACPATAWSMAYGELIDLSLDELAGIQITSVSKKPERLSDATASVFVITSEDLRRSGAVTLPEALRLAPNLQVARVDARNYAVTSRGFNGVFANKLLVLVDGRSIYTPLFSGVFWDAPDLMLEDVERIEVISGPGGTLWGANAVNGVINVITRRTDKTQGFLVSGGAGDQDQMLALRQGGGLKDAAGHYRVYGKSASSNDTRSEGDVSVAEGWRRSQTGFRIDAGEPGGPQGAVLQGDAYTARLHQAGTRDIRLGGVNLLGRVERRQGSDSNLALQVYVDHTERNQPLRFTERLDVIDVDFQHSLGLGASHKMVWGGGHRVAMDRVDNDVQVAFLPATETLHWSNVFVQDEFSLLPELRLTAGLKFERNSYTGVESMPNLRIAWKPRAEQLWWASASRAVRTPSRFDRDLRLPGQPQPVNGSLVYALNGGPSFRSEVAEVVELGHRGQVLPTVSYSATAFQSEYHRLRTVELDTSGSGLLAFGNRARARVRGLEMWGAWQVANTWRLTGGLVVQDIDQHYKAGALRPGPLEDADPRHYWTLRASGDLPGRTEADIILRGVGRLRQPAVPAYRSLDLRLGWRVGRQVELSVVGQNLLDAAHPEFGQYPGRSQFRRSVFFRAVWQL